MIDEERRFDELKREWQTLVVDRRAVTMSEWQIVFDGIRRTYDDLVSSGHWLCGRDDLLWVIGVSRRETFHSAVLAWLLTPTRRHGMGAEFLKRFLACLEIQADQARLHRARVQCEVARLETRADIVVWGEDFTLVIENKVDAGEQSRQCERLFDRFRDERSPFFVFLTPGGHEPQTTGRPEVKAQFKRLSYLHLIAVIDSITSESVAAARAVHDYRATLMREF